MTPPEIHLCIVRKINSCLKSSPKPQGLEEQFLLPGGDLLSRWMATLRCHFAHLSIQPLTFPFPSYHSICLISILYISGKTLQQVYTHTHTHTLSHTHTVHSPQMHQAEWVSANHIDRSTSLWNGLVNMIWLFDIEIDSLVFLFMLFFKSTNEKWKKKNSFRISLRLPTKNGKRRGLPHCHTWHTRALLSLKTTEEIIVTSQGLSIVPLNWSHPFCYHAELYH